MVSFGRTMMQALELLQFANSTYPDEAMFNSEEIEPIALAIIELCLHDALAS